MAAILLWRVCWREEGLKGKVLNQRSGIWKLSVGKLFVSRACICASGGDMLCLRRSVVSCLERRYRLCSLKCVIERWSRNSERRLMELWRCYKVWARLLPLQAIQAWLALTSNSQEELHPGSLCRVTTLNNTQISTAFGHNMKCFHKCLSESSVPTDINDTSTLRLVPGDRSTSQPDTTVEQLPHLQYIVD